MASRTIEQLKKVGLLSGLSDEEVAIVAGIARRVECKPGEVIMREGEEGETMYFFVEGAVDVTKSLTLKIGRKGFANAEKSMVKLQAEQVSLFGEMAMLEREPRSATITASKRCVLYEVRKDDFSRICDERPAMGLSLMRKIATMLSRRVRKGNEEVLKLSTALSIALTK
jgi:CRP-like cAMP-binding protein